MSSGALQACATLRAVRRRALAKPCNSLSSCQGDSHVRAEAQPCWPAEKGLLLMGISADGPAMVRQVSNESRWHVHCGPPATGTQAYGQREIHAGQHRDTSC